MRDSCDSLNIYGGNVPVSSGDTSVRFVMSEARIPDALCPAEGVRWRLAERRRGDRQFRSALEHLQKLAHLDGRCAAGRLKLVVPAASVISVCAESRDSLAQLFQLGASVSAVKQISG